MRTQSTEVVNRCVTVDVVLLQAAQQTWFRRGGKAALVVRFAEFLPKGADARALLQSLSGHLDLLARTTHHHAGMLPVLTKRILKGIK